ncbi:hypothetical protein OLMES_1335 [Oleiphilus messinensis]|uniref:Uncharacterized protein n=1 Tax=Oleiphilus messinensis TaxID=141451 RepID=A0A1Y0I7N6_9GAMM|nr:hypothetical protein [Oleiphilus messinensis]ARU55413.1 hypothetical protein OLMES_1335 [Oleiphilus messinensis]
MEELKNINELVNRQAVSCEHYNFKLPKSNAHISILRVKNGNSDAINSCINEYLYIEVNQLFELTKCHAFIFDVSNLITNEKADYHKILSNQIRRKHPIFLVGNTAISDTNFNLSTSCVDALNTASKMLKKYSHGGKYSPISESYYLEHRHAVNFDISKIGHNCLNWKINEQNIGAYVSMSGELPPGSAGYLDALEIKWLLRKVCILSKPRALVVDLSHLDYQWGDDLDLYPGNFWQPDSLIRFIIPHKLRSSYSGFVHENQMSENFASARQELESLIKGNGD